MDHSRAPVLEALQEFRHRGDLVYGPPGHKQGRGADPRVLEVVGESVFASDVLSLTASTTGGSRRGSPARPRTSWPTPSMPTRRSSPPAAAHCR